MKLDNRIALGLKFMGIIFMILGFVGFIVDIRFNPLSAVLCIAGGLMIGLILMGIGEIITLLEKLTAQAKHSE